MAGALNCETIARQVFVTIDFLQRCLHALDGAVRRVRRRVSRSTVCLVDTDHIFGFLENEFHVVDIDANIFSRDVTPVQRINKTTKSPEQGF